MNLQVHLRCLKLGMPADQAEWVARNYQHYASIDWSRMEYVKINAILDEIGEFYKPKEAICVL